MGGSRGPRVSPRKRPSGWAPTPPPRETALGLAVDALLAERKAAMAPGPRSRIDLAKVLDVQASSFTRTLNGQRPAVGRMAVDKIEAALGLEPGTLPREG